MNQAPETADAHATEVDDLAVGPFHTHLHAVGVEHSAATAHRADPRACIVEHRSTSGCSSLAVDAAGRCPMDDLDHFSSSVWRWLYGRPSGSAGPRAEVSTRVGRWSPAAGAPRQ